MNRREQQRGSALIEFAFIIPVTVLLALGIFDFAYAIQQSIAISAAAHIGALYGATEGQAYNTTSMQSYALASAPSVPGMTATATTYCSCTPGGSIVNCSSNCNTYDIPMEYAQVVTSAPLRLLVPFPGITLNMNFAGKSIIRER